MRFKKSPAIRYQVGNTTNTEKTQKRKNAHPINAKIAIKHEYLEPVGHDNDGLILEGGEELLLHPLLFLPER